MSREVRPTFLMQLLMLSPELVYPTSWATLGGPVFCFSEYFLVKELKKEKKKKTHTSHASRDLNFGYAVRARAVYLVGEFHERTSGIPFLLNISRL